jgi:uncharacterized protein YjbI with pentapeptide repeats
MRLNSTRRKDAAMSTSATVESTAQSGFVCGCKDTLRSACDAEWPNPALDGKHYCVIHFPGSEKRQEFRSILANRLKRAEFDFRGAWFPEEFSPLNFSIKSFDANADFTEAVFNAPVDFLEIGFKGDAIFVGSVFKGRANFVRTKFTTASFFEARFESAVSFTGATFSSNAIFSKATLTAKATFSDAAFGGRADFMEAAFEGNADFRFATFTGHADFHDTSFAGYIEFRQTSFNVNNRPTAQGYGSLDLQFAKIEKANHLSFHTLILHPHWFRNVDARKIDFDNIVWNNNRNVKNEIKLLRSINFDHIPWWGRFKLKGMIKELRDDETKSLASLATTFRKLAANAEDNARYPQASDFRRLAMDAERLKRWRGFPIWQLSWWYWLASGYGERAVQALAMLTVVWLLFALVYMHPSMKWESKPANSTIVQPSDVTGVEKFKTELVYSLGVMTLQKPEPRPSNRRAQAAVLAQTILGPLQAAMLALAIRRKFMR